MKLLAIVNGWREAPHRWMAHLFVTPMKVTTVPGHKGRRGWWSVSIFGFVFFFEGRA